MPLQNDAFLGEAADCWGRRLGVVHLRVVKAEVCPAAVNGVAVKMSTESHATRHTYELTVDQQEDEVRPRSRCDSCAE